MKHKLLTTVLGLFMALLVITGSIALPIYFRPFYYWQVESLGVPQITGYDRATVIAAYDEVLDYLTLPSAPFGTGVFPHSEAGESHFADCKALFALNTTVLLISLVAVVLLLLLCRRGVFRLWAPKGRHIATWVGREILITFAILGALVAVDFNRAFMAFHSVFFPGKENWIFDIHVDPIINALPEAFFLNCGALIFGSIVLCCVLLLIYGSIKKRAEQ